MPRRGEIRVGEALEFPPPGLLLVFEVEEWDQSQLPRELRQPRPGHMPVRPIAVAEVAATIEQIYLVSLAKDAPPPDYAADANWAWKYDLGSLEARLGAIRMESDLYVLLDLPWPVYTAAFSALAFGLAHVFGVPYKAVARFHKARREYFESRLEAEVAKQNWFDWKKQQAEQQLPFRLREVHEAAKLPPPGESMELPPPGDPDYPANG